MLDARRKTLKVRKERIQDLHSNLKIKDGKDPMLPTKIKYGKLLSKLHKELNHVEQQLGLCTHPKGRMRRISKLEKKQQKALKFWGEMKSDVCENDPNLPSIVIGNKVIRELPFDELYSTYAEHTRLIVFAQKGLKCVHPECHRRGTRLLETMDLGGSVHVDLFTDDLYLMTVDHIIPKSKGGGEELINKQPMCAGHNFKKSDKLIPY